MFVYLCVPKCASSTMSTYLRRCGAKAIGRKVAVGYHDRIAIIRHPLARTISAYNFGWRAKGLSFEEWWDFVRQNPSFDRHTTPIVECLAGEYSDVRRLEEIESWWHDWAEQWPWAFQELPGVVNASKGGEVNLTAELIEDILDVYSEDLSLWAKSESVSSTDGLLIDLPRS